MRYFTIFLKEIKYRQDIPRALNNLNTFFLENIIRFVA